MHGQKLGFAFAAWLAGCSGSATQSPAPDGGARENAFGTLRPSQEKLDFGTTPCGERALPQSVEITNTSSATVKWGARLEKGEQARYEFNPSRGELAPGGQAKIEVTPKAVTLSRDSLSDALLVEATGLASARVALVETALGGAVISTPREVDLGEVIAGRAAMHVVTLANSGSAAVTLGLKATGALKLVEDAGTVRIEPKHASSIGVRVESGDAGEHSGSLELTTQDRLCSALPSPLEAKVLGVTHLAGNLALGEAFSCAQAVQGRVACWGAADRGQIGVRLTGSTPIAPLPLAVPGVGAPARIVAGAQHACALQRDGIVACWGSNSFGQLARASDGIVGGAPVDAVKGAAGLGAGATHTCAVRGGEILCWGDNARGQVGLAPSGALHIVRVPSRVAGLSDAISVAAGGQYSCAVRQGGEVTCWGANIGGIVEGGNVPDWRAAASIGVTDAVGLGVGVGHACAVRRGGTVACWGKNDRGQLGDGTLGATLVSVPSSVLALDDAVAVAAGTSFTCALKRSGKVACWGDNGSGQLALASRQQASSPELVPGVEGASAIAAGAFHACARVGDSTVCWGFNASGQLGTGGAGAPGLPTRALPF